MKLDKETLIKHKFWIVLGTVIPLLIMMLCVLKFGVAGTVEERQKEYNNSVTAVKGISNPKNAEFIKPVKEKQDTLNKKKSKVWEQAWNGQGSLITWPQEMQRELGNNYYGDFIPEEERRKYARLYDAGYRSKLETEFTELIAPVEFKSGFNSIIRTVPEWSQNVPPLLEEIYLAQEDISVQRELLKIISSTLDTLKKFTLVEPAKGETKAKLPAGVLATYVYRNANWEMRLSLALNDKKQLMVSGAHSTIKNINTSKRTMALDKAQFRIMQGNAGSVLFRIPAEYVLWNQEVLFRNDVSIDKFNKNSPLEVEQAFDWYASPIKRVDALVMGYQSHRTANYALKMRKIDDTMLVAAGPTGAGVKGGFGLMGGTPPPNISGGSLPPTTGQSGGDATAAALPDATPNKLSRYRYLDVRDQVRWMPIGMVLIIDQSAVQDVLSAIANSRLRIQTTQVTWSHVSNIKPDKIDIKGENRTSGSPPPLAKGGGDEFPGGPGQKAIMPRLPGSAPSGAGGPPPGFPGFPGAPGFSGPGFAEMRRSYGDQDDPNLIELSIYGIASLYERYPPKTQTAAASTPSGSTAPGTTAPGSQVPNPPSGK